MQKNKNKRVYTKCSQLQSFFLKYKISKVLNKFEINFFLTSKYQYTKGY